MDENLKINDSQETMTIIRALAELNNIDRKIINKTNDAKFVANKVKSKKIEDRMTVEEFTNKAKSAYDSITGLINRYQQIKSAIIISNATTSVIIDNKKMTVAEAIEMKINIIEYKKNLLNELRKQAAKINNELVFNNNLVDGKFEKAAENSNFDKNSKEEKDINNYIKFRDMYYEKNEWIIVDPLNITNKIEFLEKEIMDFETEVNYILTESNTKTMIKI
jgi:hypothetical protein